MRESSQPSIHGPLHGNHPSPHLDGLTIPQLPELAAGLVAVRQLYKEALSVEQYATTHKEALQDSFSNGAILGLNSMTSPFSLDVLSDLAVGSKILSTYLEVVEQQIEQLFRHTHQLAPGDFKIDSIEHRETELGNIDRCGSPSVFIHHLSGHIEEFTRALKRFCYEVPYIQKIYEEDYRGFERPETEGAGWLATLKRASDRRIETLSETHMGANAILRFLQEAPRHYQETSSLAQRPSYDITSSETP